MVRRTYDPAKHCGGKNRRGEPCTQAKGWKTDHPGDGYCAMHGGNTTSHKVKVHRDELRSTADKWLLASDDIVEPVKVEDVPDLLGRLASKFEHAVDAIGSRCNALQDLSIVTMAGGEQVRAEIRLWLDLTKQLQSLMTDLTRTRNDEVKLGLAEREVRLAEAQQAQLAEGLRWAVAEVSLRLDLAEHERAVVLDVMAEMTERLDRMESGAKV